MASDPVACEHESITTLAWDDSKRPAAWMCRDCRRKFAPLNVALLEAAHETLHWLEGQQADEEADCGRPQCSDCIPRRDRQVAIDALRAALGVSNG
jgi:hypothetical protein